MQKINEVVKKVYGKEPEKILQIGDGNFLRAFSDWMIDEANEKGLYKGSVILCAPQSAGKVDMLNEQDGLYTLIMRGIENGVQKSQVRQITSVSRAIKIKDEYKEFLKIAGNPDLEVVISNTTEAGIVYKKEALPPLPLPPSTFPAKMAAFLYERFKLFNGDKSKGLLFLPVELIDNNGDMLKKYILQYAVDWAFGQDFKNWLENSNKFTNTLVDRIVTGFPTLNDNEALKYEDKLITAGELFNLWVIEGKKEWADIFPIHKTSANVVWTDDVKPFKKRKVRILNGAHTSTVLAAYLAGHNFVLDFMQDAVFARYLNDLLFEEVIPSLDLARKDLEDFAGSVKDRFSNPYIKHSLLDIALNSCAKFNTRCLPSIIEYQQKSGKIPQRLAFSFAVFIKFYQGKMEDGKFIGQRENGEPYQIRDNSETIDFFNQLWLKNPTEQESVKAVLSNKTFWEGKDLNQIDGLTQTISQYLKQINQTPIKKILEAEF
ncbi:MAG: tagaturonate reductase [Elusimicrobiota bacterium]|jgi:tagaturonate reductase|nr:tagaturonate reductase [Elusimicrobiota bacterium]